MLGVFPKEQSTAAAGQSSSMDRIDAAKLKLDARGGRASVSPSQSDS
jgi:hypothetical protein